MTSNAAMTSPAPSASAVPPEQLAVAARALGGIRLFEDWSDRWRLELAGNDVRIIGSDADLCAAIRRALLSRGTSLRIEYLLTGDVRIYLYNPFKDAFRADELSAHLTACIAAMGAT